MGPGRECPRQGGSPILSKASPAQEAGRGGYGNGLSQAPRGSGEFTSFHVILTYCLHLGQESAGRNGNCGGMGPNTAPDPSPAPGAVYTRSKQCCDGQPFSS
ncbi:hypothetical protein GCM10009097_08340 [Pigmentiphaga daeguensis]|uniref:Uncharacterized protein n=1 Tax=Pigmentiphaga daeguensis TaxID=414049 RepID=A0ABN1BCB0_9BURK